MTIRFAREEKKFRLFLFFVWIRSPHMELYYKPADIFIIKNIIYFIFERNIIIFAMNISNMKGSINTNKSITQYLKSKIVAKGLTHSDVVGLLNKEGIKCTESSFTTKLNRGTFSATFFIQCLNILGCEVADIKEIIKNKKK